MATPARLGVLLPHADRFSATDLLLVARAAEAAGYSTVSTGEVAAFDAISLLCAVGVSTMRVELMTGVIPMATRSMALTAMGLATLSSIAPGRALAGVGASSPEVVTGWHGLPYGRPVAQVEGYISSLRRALRGDGLSGDPRPGDFRLAAPATAMPVILAAINSRMLQAAGRYADGVYLALCTPEDSAEKVAIVREAAASAGRNPDAIRVFASVYGRAGTEGTDHPRLKRDLLGYATLPTHRAGFAKVFKRMDQIDHEWGAGRRAAALSLIGDDEIGQLAALGTADDVLHRIGEYRAVGVDTPVLLPVPRTRGDLADVLSTVITVGAAAARADDASARKPDSPGELCSSTVTVPVSGGRP